MNKIIKDSIIENFRLASRKYSDASIFMHEAIARKAGLSGADHKYLEIILQYKELTAGDIAKLTGLTTGAVTGLIDRLEKKKLLKRQFTKEDIENLRLVYHLVKEKGHTLQGAKEILKTSRKKLVDNLEAIEALEKVKSFLIELRKNLK